MGHHTIRLSDICDQVVEQVDPQDQPDAIYLGLEHIASGRFVPIGAGRGADVSSSKHAFKSGDVLYGKLRPYLDKAVLSEHGGVCSTELLVLRPKEGTNARFLAGVLHAPSFINHAISGTAGVQHPRTSWAHIREFALPTFVSREQEKIADLLWLTHEAITASEKTVAEGAALKRAAMRELFTRGLRGEAQKETEIGLMPESWEVVPLGSLGRVGNGSTPKKSVSEYWTGGTYPWLTSAKVYDREITGADQLVTERALAECHLPRIKQGAVLIAITGQGKTLGHCAVLGIEATINQHMAYVAVETDRALPHFVCSYLETQYHYLRQVGSGGGSTKGALTCSFLRSLPVPLPRADEQREVAAVLHVIDRKIDMHEAKRVVLDELFKALLHKLMTGEIRVTDLDLAALKSAPAAEATA